MNPSADNPVLWQPDENRRKESAIYRFMQEQGASDYAGLHAWSIAEPALFWQALVGFCDVSFDKPADEVLYQPGDMTTAKSWDDQEELSSRVNQLVMDEDVDAHVEGRRIVVQTPTTRDSGPRTSSKPPLKARRNACLSHHR